MIAPRNENPYRGVDWARRIEITGCTHMHCTTQEEFRRFAEQGLELATFSNYYPSAPYCPLRSIRENTFRCRQHGFVRDGSWRRETLDFNREISRWADELPPEIRGQLPFEEKAPLFSDIPEGLLEAPNAEHHWFSDAGIWLHVTAPGAGLSSGSFDWDHRFQVAEHGVAALGAPVPWRDGFRALLDSLAVPDGGGIVIAHPEWSHLPSDFLIRMLDSDPRVLGMEIFNYNDTCDFGGFCDCLWDEILATGRQCFGFAVQDHLMDDGEWRGRIILLPEERTAESCLRAMRLGRFYCAITGAGLRFEHLDFDGRILRARCDREAVFQLISRTGVIGDETRGKEFRYDLPEDRREEHVFLRLTAKDPQGREKLFAQPFMLVRQRKERTAE